ncbi:unnamed protein product [Arabis nemorensis]|uniref:Uncharacterized protein n=1 Tax=Arabis nemorensis TaxID=586526 RepID=A0A565C7B5_9BRAS|nr:unnamed protein product [Arabis nemorensis]
MSQWQVTKIAGHATPNCETHDVAMASYQDSGTRVNSQVQVLGSSKVRGGHEHIQVKPGLCCG